MHASEQNQSLPSLTRDSGDTDSKSMMDKPSLKLQLHRQHAVHVKTVMIDINNSAKQNRRQQQQQEERRRRRRDLSATPSFNLADYHLIHQFLKYPLITHTDPVVSGFCRRCITPHFTHSHESTDTIQPNCASTLQMVPKEIERVCRSYLVNEEDGIFQLAYRVYIVLRALKKCSAATKLLLVVIADYLKLPRELQFYLDQMKRWHYVETVDAGNKKAYCLTMMANVCCEALSRHKYQ